MAVVAIDGLSKRYDGSAEAAVSAVSLAVGDGEFMVLLGPSGCGKSSVLRMIAGLEPITAGTVAIDGKVVNEVPAKDRDIAMVFQSYALYPHMDVYNNLAFGLRRRRVAKDEIDKRVRAAAGKLGLEPYLARKPHALSGGQRQRVALGRAIVREPKVFLFDEPLSNLDAALRVSTRNELIRQQHELGITTIYVTHDQVEAMTMGHRICIMDKGQVVQIGPPLQVYRNPVNTFVARFLGNPPMNLIEATLEAGGGETRLRLGTATLPLSGATAAAIGRQARARLVLGIRPEDLYEAAPGLAEARMAPLAMRVVAIEPLGAETLLLLTLEGPGVEVIARTGRETRLKPGEKARMLIDTGALHLFDPVTTRVIGRGEASA
ncbi:MAG: sn-glycerol-3-phosphate ABC transporter ATP-binding protein UgpC [Proteobacteria bacterium]|nr:sn-glycerol-3-phosphate ABC transporter ATP-binding protein UgpC [Pseudomonadota bacterium]MBI3498616.1 sn-glycerol-3-phosphate ABC transporter ATP-binding protein UgpC [Pseudomonadota bacterium]